MPSPPPRPTKLPDDYEEMEFTIENEEWNEYELKDGTRIKGRVVLQKLLRDPNNPNLFNFNVSKAMWVVYAPSTLRSKPNYNPTEKPAEKFEVHVNRSNEPWNIYRVSKTGQKLRIKLVVTEVSRFVDKFDNQGLPVYDVPNGISIAVSKSDVKQAQ